MSVSGEDPELVIKDEVFTQAGKNCSTQGKRLEEAFGSYLTILQDIADHAVTSGEVHEATTQFIALAKQIKGKLDGAGSRGKKICDGFVLQVDHDDQYLY